MAKVSKNIKKLRNEKGLTQDFLAEKINVTRQTVSSWENDRTQPDIEMLELLANTFEVGIEELIYGEKRNVGLEAPKPDRRRAMNIVFATLGSLLTATGLIIVLVSFWDEIPEIFLAFMSFVPLLLGGGIAAWAYAKKKNSIGWSEGSSVAWVAGLAATFGLAVTMFGIDLDFDISVMGLSALILPIALIMNSVFPLTVYYGITTFYIAENIHNPDVFSIFASIVLFTAGLVYVIKQPADDYRRKYSVWLVIISSSVILSFLATESTQTDGIPALFTIIIGILTALYAADNGENPAYSFRFISVPAISVIMCILCFATDDCVRGGYYISNTPKLLFPGIAPFAAAIIITSGAYFGRESLKNNPLKKSFIAFSSLTAAICTASSAAAEFFNLNDKIDVFLNIVITIISLAISIIIIIAGIKKAKMLTVNLGLLMLCFIIYLTIFAGNFDIVYSGIACIVMGGILLFLNFRMSKAFKAKEGEKNA